MTTFRSREDTGIRRWIAIAGLAFVCLFFAQASSAWANNVFFSVNHDTSATSMVQGDTIGWGATCTVGDSLIWSIWCDINANGVIDDPGDVLVASFSTADGDVSGYDGPPDNSPTPDGVYQTPDMFFAIAPTHYVFKVEYSDHSTAQRALVVTAMPSPPNTFSGTITIPGHTAPDALLQYLWVEADAQSDGSIMSSALTDNSGHFTINVSTMGTGLDFQIKAPMIPGYVSPSDQVHTASGDVTGVDFAYLAPSDSIYGQIKDLDDSLITIPLSVWCQKQDMSQNKDVNTTTGTYSIPFASSELGQWMIGVGQQNLNPNYLVPFSWQFDNSSVHGINHDIICPKADTALYVKVTENGGNPTHSYAVQCQYDALGYFNQAYSDTGTNNVMAMGISKHYLSGWSVQVINWDTTHPIPSGYVLESTPSNLHPGDTAKLNFISGKMVRDTIKFDAADGSVAWDSLFINLWDGVHSYNGAVDNNGVYTAWADTGTYSVNLVVQGYLVKPNTAYQVHVTGDTVGGLGYQINRTTCKVTGTLQNVPLPLGGITLITAHTGIGTNAYQTSATVNSVDGTYTLWLCDGNWTIDPPFVPNRMTPTAPQLTVGNVPDTAHTVDLLYSSVADVNDGSAGSLPKAFALGQNYPNPFNPSTQISYDLPVATHVELTVFDLLGRRVATLVNQEMPAGRYTATWDGTDNAGHNTASGIYFYRIVAGQFSEARKMIFLK